MQSGDVVTVARDWLGESDPSGRFSDAQMLRALCAAMYDVSLDVRFPEMSYSVTTVPNVQEYTLPEFVALKRVYLASQPIYFKSIDTLQGDQIGLYDTTTAGYLPQWTAAAPAVYPVSADQGYPVPIAEPYYAGARPSYYDRGPALIGFVPMPATGVTLRVDGIAFPPATTSLTDTLIYPRAYLNMLAWSVVKQALFSDKDDTLYGRALVEMKEAKQQLFDWFRSFSPAQSIQPLTYRSIFDVSQYRTR